MAQSCQVPVVTGSTAAFASWQEAAGWVEAECSYPVIVKALMGGGGRGIRIVRTAADMELMFREASNEAATAFGDGRCFVEKYVEEPRHIEVQCLGDGSGNVVHLWDRDCSVQRRHQKVIELAPAEGMPDATRAAVLTDAVRLLAAAKYKNAGTVEFLVDKYGSHYFMEVNPRYVVAAVALLCLRGCEVAFSHRRNVVRILLSAHGIKCLFS
jgi:pyruvate carboxylase